MNWALLDQAMVSGVNFLTGLLLARFLGLEEFGLYTLIWMVVLFANSIQNAMISAPMMSIGVKQSNIDESQYYRSVMGQQLVFSLLSFLFIWGGVYITSQLVPSWQLDSLVLPLALAGTLFQFQDFLRRYFFSRKLAKNAFYNDVISYMGQIILLFVLFMTTEIDVQGVLWVIALTSAIAVVFGLLTIDIKLASFQEIKQISKRHWQFSKWSTLNALLQWASGNLIFIITGSVLGNTSVGILKAAQNIMAISHILFQAMENFVPMKASSVFTEYGKEALKKYINKVVLLGGSLTVALAIIVALFSSELLFLLYGDQFEGHSYVLRWFSVIYVFMFLGVPYRIALRTVENTKAVFQSQALSSLFTLVFAYPLIAAFGLSGTLLSLLIVYLVVITFLYFSFSKKQQR